MMKKREGNRRVLLICLVLTVVTLGVFWQVRGHEFINYDDPEYVTENQQVQSGLTIRGLPWAFTTFHASNWHPLTWLSHMLDYQLFGLDPAGHHAMNLFFHLANTLLLFLVLHRMTKALWQSVFVAALFALHPMHVESVAWVAERKDVLSTFFWMLTMAAYVRYVERQSIGRYLLVLLFFVLGLMSKPMVVTLPFVLLLLDYWPLGRLRAVTPGVTAGEPVPGQSHARKKMRKDGQKYLPESVPAKGPESGYRWRVIRSWVWEKIPLFVFSAGSCIITVYAQQKGNAITSLHQLPFDARLENALISSATYMIKMIWPGNLAVFYPYPAIQPLWLVLGAALILMIITIPAIGGAKRFPHLAVGWFWFLGTLLPVIGLVQVGSQSMADRYTYIPLIGLFVMAAWGVPELVKKWSYGTTVVATAAVVILLACATVTYSQVQYWRDSIVLWRHALSVTTDNHVAHYNIGDALVKQGQTGEAESHLREAFRINPEDAEVSYNLGNVLRVQGKNDEAVIYFREALRIKSDYAAAHNNLGIILASRGLTDEALFHFSAAIRIDPNDEMSHNNMGKLLFSQGRNKEGIAHIRIALRIKPDFAEGYYNLGYMLASQGMLSEAISSFASAIRLNPQDFRAHNNMGNALRAQGKIDDAIAHFESALRIEPDFTLARDNLRNTLTLRRIKQGSVN